VRGMLVPRHWSHVLERGSLGERAFLSLLSELLTLEGLVKRRGPNGGLRLLNRLRLRWGGMDAMLQLHSCVTF